MQLLAALYNDRILFGQLRIQRIQDNLRLTGLWKDHEVSIGVFSSRIYRGSQTR